MQAVKQSFVQYVLFNIARLFRSGLTGRVWSGFTARFSCCVRSSAVYALLTRDGAWLRRWRASMLHRLTGLLADLIPRGLGLVCRGRGKRERCFTAHCLDALADRRHIILGLVFMLMLCIPYELWNNLYGAAGAAAVFALYYFWAIPRRRAAFIDADRLSPMYLVFLFCVALALIFSEHRGLSLRFFVFHLACALTAVTVTGSVENVKQLRTMLYIVLVGLLISSLYGCWQAITGVEYLAYQLDASINTGITGRIYSFFSNPNNYCTFIVMLLPFALALFISARSARERVFCAAVLVITLISCGATYSRSGWIGLIAAVAVFIIFTDWRYMLMLAALCLIALPLLPETIITRLTTIGNMKDSSSRYRMQIYAAFGRLLKIRWTTGVGLGTDATFEALHDLPAMEDGRYALHSHNNYMQLCAEIGITGAFAYAAALLGRLKDLAAASERTRDRTLRPIIAAAAGSMTGIMLMGMVDYTWYYPRSMFVFWFLFGIMTLCDRLSRRDAQN
ncbi:MAG: O-antigen ligase family protein [Oscillospiraceae bacterium]|nr:O-antigen ligase family protein [Oscillospiraceae bacterium]